jgi:hypothetical protein
VAFYIRAACILHSSYNQQTKYLPQKKENITVKMTVNTVSGLTERAYLLCGYYR